MTNELQKFLTICESLRQFAPDAKMDEIHTTALQLLGATSDKRKPGTRLRKAKATAATEPAA